MSEYLDESIEEIPLKRPVFLKVLCILTFISCGLGFLSATYGLTTQSKMVESLKYIPRPGRDNAFINVIDHIDDIVKWSTIGNYLSLANCLLCLGGALLMWNLKKVGFFVYSFGQILPFITLLGMYSALKDIPLLGFAMLLGSFFATFFAIAFIIMYGVNLKYMRR